MLAQAALVVHVHPKARFRGADREEAAVEGASIQRKV